MLFQQGSQFFAIRHLERFLRKDISAARIEKFVDRNGNLRLQAVAVGPL